LSDVGGPCATSYYYLSVVTPVRRRPNIISFVIICRYGYNIILAHYIISSLEHSVKYNITNIDSRRKMSYIVYSVLIAYDNFSPRPNYIAYRITGSPNDHHGTKCRVVFELHECSGTYTSVCIRTSSVLYVGINQRNYCLLVLNYTIFR